MRRIVRRGRQQMFRGHCGERNPWLDLQSIRKKSSARPASPRSRPTSPVNGAGGITGCREDSEPPSGVPCQLKYSEHGYVIEVGPNPTGFVRVVSLIAM